MNRLPISPRLSRALSLICAVLLLTAVVAWGSIKQGRTFLARGIPPALPEPMIGAGLGLGVNVDLPANEAALTALLDQLSAAHLRQIKATFSYSDAFDWALVEQQLAQIEAAGLTLTPLLDGDPTNQFAPPADPEQFAAWAGEFASR
ncbi:MAG: hypothetical protein KDE59_21295, partial [Anaerolineales bacterium]|nr:hypothetical protein [Anaerolineales bacterium]